MAFEVSATMTTSDPAPLVMAICDFAALNSSRAERLSNSAEYQPPTKLRPNSASLSLSAVPSLGILWPFSIPTTPASFAWARQVSSGVSPPTSCKSSLVQPIGLAPMRMLISVSNPLQRLGLLIAAARGVDFLPLGNLRHGDVPPEAARVRRSHRVGVDDNHLGRLCGARISERRLKVRDRLDLHRFRPKSARVGDEVDLRHRLMAYVTQKVVERRAPSRLLQTVDAAKAPIVVDDDNEFLPQHHGRGDLRIHHEIRAVAENHDHFPIRQRHLDADPAGDLVAHAGITVFEVVAQWRARSPQLVQFPRQSARGADDHVRLLARAHERAEHFGVGWRWRVGRRDVAGGSRFPFGLGLGGFIAPGARRLPGIELGIKRHKGGPGVADDRQSLMFCRIEGLDVE